MPNKSPKKSAAKKSAKKKSASVKNTSAVPLDVKITQYIKTEPTTPVSGTRSSGAEGEIALQNLYSEQNKAFSTPQETGKKNLFGDYTRS